MQFNVEIPARLHIPGERLLTATRVYRGVTWKAEFFDAGVSLGAHLYRNGSPADYGKAPSHARAFANEACELADQILLA